MDFEYPISDLVHEDEALNMMPSIEITSDVIENQIIPERIALKAIGLLPE